MFLIGSGLPISPVQMESTVTATTANITWTASVMSCLPENYTVLFHGLELQPELRETELIVGDTINIQVPNRVHFVLLERLEEANRYIYTLRIFNHNGMTSTDMMQFTTLPDCELSHPLLVIVITK